MRKNNSVTDNPTCSLEEDCADWTHNNHATDIKYSTYFVVPFLKWENTGADSSHSSQSAWCIQANIWEIIVYRRQKSTESH